VRRTPDTPWLRACLTGKKLPVFNKKEIDGMLQISCGMLLPKIGEIG